MQVLKLEQVAHTMVHWSPWLPDIMAVAAVIPQSRGTPRRFRHLVSYPCKHACRC